MSAYLFINEKRRKRDRINYVLDTRLARASAKILQQQLDKMEEDLI